MGLLSPKASAEVIVFDFKEGWILSLPTDEKKSFVVDQPYFVTAIYQGRVHNLSVPCGFKTDLASVPRVATIFIPQFGRHSPAALFHDWCYEQEVDGYHSKAFADALFFALLKRMGVGAVKSASMYAAVKIGGRGNYK
jgi:hypothetical protein